MTGSLQSKKNKYYIVLSYKDPETLKNATKWVSTKLEVKGNKKKAEAFISDMINKYKYLEEVRANDNLNESVLFSDYLNEWLELHRGNVEEITYCGHESIIRVHLYPYFKRLGISLSNLKAIHIQKYYSDKMKPNSAADGKSTLATNSLCRHHAVLRKALDYAVRTELIISNPADKVQKPKQERYKGAYYNADEINNLLKVVKGTTLEIPVIIACYYGLRRSEIVGLKWDAIDFVNKTITIKHKIVIASQTGHKREIISKDKLKNESSFRTLPLLPVIGEILLRIKQKQQLLRMAFPDSYIDEYTDYICVNEIGDLIKPDFISHKFLKVLRANKMKEIRFHDLRHSCASLLLRLGFSMKEIQEWLGHADFSTTANIYSHIDVKAKEEMGNKLANVINI